MKISPTTVYLVGAGPGDPDLITVRGMDLLRSGDVIVYDRLIAQELLLQRRPGAELINVGKSPGKSSIPQEEINQILIDRALQGKRVVRLKGGDPFVFGRGGEEQEACRKAGIRCVVVPGVSSALAAPASIGIPVTYREKSRHFVVVTAHSNGKGQNMDYSALAAIHTLVILMGRTRLAEICRSLIVAGKNRATPAACVEWATTRKQRMTSGTLHSIAKLADREGLRAPLVTIIGEVAALAQPGNCELPPEWSSFDSLWPISRDWGECQ